MLLLILNAEPMWAAPTTWQTISPGVSYAQLLPEPPAVSGRIHAFKIDLTQYTPVCALAKTYKRRFMSAQAFAKALDAPLVINGGFFDWEGTPLGLRLCQGEVQNPKRDISWWAVFSLSNQRMRLERTAYFKQDADVSFAIQAGPRLVVRGLPVSHLKPGLDQRTAICQHRDGSFVLIATEKYKLSATAFAKRLADHERQDGLGCEMALNLDGGTSTQLYAKFDGFERDIPNYIGVADAVAILPR